MGASGSHVGSNHFTRNWRLPLCCRSDRISSTKDRSFSSKSKIGSGGFSRLPLREVSSTKCRTSATLKTGCALQTTGSCTFTVAKFGTLKILKGPSHCGANLAHGWSREVSVDKKSQWINTISLTLNVTSLRLRSAKAIWSSSTSLMLSLATSSAFLCLASHSIPAPCWTCSPSSLWGKASANSGMETGWEP